MSTAPPTPDAQRRVRPLTDYPEWAAQASELLRGVAVSLPLTPEDAQQVVAHMGLARFAPGTLVMREGQAEQTDHLLLILDGQMEIGLAAPDGETMALSVLGPGSVVGEVALFDGAPRSATCTTVGPVVAAGLSRRGLDRLIEAHPRAGARLMLCVCQRLAERLRALSEQVRLYAQMASDQQAELQRLRGGG